MPAPSPDRMVRILGTLKRVAEETEMRARDPDTAALAIDTRSLINAVLGLVAIAGVALAADKLL